MSEDSLHAATIRGDVVSVEKFLIKGSPTSIRFDHGNTILHLAVKNNHPEVIKVLLPKVIMLNDVNNDGETPFHMAIRLQYMGCIEVLLPKEPNINLAAPKKTLEAIHKHPEHYQDKETGYTPLMTALHYRNQQLISLLLQYNASVDCKDCIENTPLHLISGIEDGGQCLSKILKNNHGLKHLEAKNCNQMTPLLCAIENGSLKTIEMLLEAGASLHVSDMYSQGPLHIAIIYGNFIIFELLTRQKNIKLNEKNTFGNTPLMESLLRNRIDFAMHLLQKKCDVKVTNDLGLSALYIAVNTNNVEMASQLIHFGSSPNDCISKETGDTPLTCAFSLGNRTMIETLLKTSVSFKSVNGDKNNVFHLAVMSNDISLLGLLFSKEHSESTSLLVEKNNRGLTPLHIAVANNNLAMAEMLVKNHAPVDAKDLQNSTPLFIAAAQGFTDILKMLLNNKASVNCRNSDKDSPLNIALDNRKFECAKLLVSNGANIKNPDENGDTPLHEAVDDGVSEIVEVLLSMNPPLNLKNKLGFTPLAIAVSKNYVEIVKLLVSAGADLDIKDNSGNTALHLAIESGYYDVLLILLSKKCNLEIKNKNNDTPLNLALIRKQVPCAILLIEAGANINTSDSTGVTPIESTVEINQVELLRALIVASVKANVVRKDTGESPLMDAINRGYSECASILINYPGCDINFCKNNQTALHISSRLAMTEITSLLLSKNPAHINDKDNNDRTPLHYSVQNNDFQNVKTLLGLGADANIKDREGNTSVHLAASFGFPSILEILLDNKGKTDVKNNDGESPLSLSLINRKIDCAVILVNRGSKITTTDNEGESPLHIATENGYVELVNALLQKGAKVNIRNKNNESPLMEAVQRNYVEIVRLLVGAGASVEKTSDQSKNSPINFAAANGFEQILAILLSKLPKLDERNKDGDTPLESALINGQIKCAKILIKAGANVNYPNKNGLTPVHATVQLPYQTIALELLQEIINKGAEVEGASKETGETALMFAIKNEIPQFVKLLISNGGKTETRDKEGNNSLHLAASRSTEILNLLLETNINEIVNVKNNASLTPLLIAVQQNSLENVKILLKLPKINVECTDKNGDNLLHYAIFNPIMLSFLLGSLFRMIDRENNNRETPLLVALQSNNIESAEILIKAGALPLRISNLGVTPFFVAIKNSILPIVELMISKHSTCAKDDKSNYSRYPQNPLFVAAENQDFNIIKLLINSGVSSNIKNHKNNSMIHVCAETGDTKTLQFLLSRECEDINSKNSDSLTPLFLAVSNLRIEATELLLQNGASENCVDEEGNGLLSIASLLGSPQMVSYLLKRTKIQVDTKNYKNKTPLILISKFNENQYLETAQVLISAGANVNIAENSGKTALHFAAEAGNLPFIQLLLSSHIDVLIKDNDGLRAHDVARKFGCNEAHDLIKGSSESLQEHRPNLVPNDNVHYCSLCKKKFSLLVRKHHCHHCGQIFCSHCTEHSVPIVKFNYPKPVSVCTTCFNFLQKEN